MRLRKFMKFIVSVIMIALIILIVTHQEEIRNYYNEIVSSNTHVHIEKPNDYTRYYNYSNFKILSSEEEYTPKNIDDLKNIIYNYLNNGWKEFTFYCPSEYEECMEDIEKLSNDVTLLSSINNYISPYNSFNDFYTKISSNRSITLTKVSNYPDEVINTLDNKINKIMTSLKLDDLSDRDKIKKLHNYIIKKVEYDKDPNAGSTSSASAYGALINKKAICSGYADTMAIFLDKLNIPNFKVATDNHVWNAVYIDDEWLHLDATWDDPINAITTNISNTYFLITSEQLLQLDTTEHSFDTKYYQELKK